MQMEWTAEEEIHLFFALEGLRPVGVNKHFHVFSIADRLSKSLNREIPADMIWKKLHSMYNLSALDKLEPVPPFASDEEEFSLPDADFLSLKRRNEEKRLNLDSSDGSTTSTCPPSIIAVSTDNTTKEKSTTLVKTASHMPNKEADKKSATKLVEAPKRPPKRTRGSMESSPSTTPPPIPNIKRRRI